MTKRKEEVKVVKENEALPAQAVEGITALPQEFIKAEKNLETLGFFTPSSNWTRNTKKKLVSFTKTEGNQRVKASAVILPSAEYGLPDTSDLDKYRAFQKILTDKLKRDGSIPQYVTFTSADLIKAMGKKEKKGGKAYKEIKDWLMRMKLTGIQSEGAVWLAGQRVWVTDTVNVFDRVVIYGQQLDDGTIAAYHHVWLSQWQLGNINEFWLLSLDYDLHKQLRKPIAKSLLPLLQIGFYASGGTYTKRYDELCQFLGIKNHQKPSYIKRQLEPPFKELQGKGFLANWDYDENKIHKTYNITWWAGERFYEMQEILRERENKLTAPATKKPKRITKPKRTSEKSQQQPVAQAEDFPEPEPEEEVNETKSTRKGKQTVENLSPIAEQLCARGMAKSAAIDFAENFPEDYLTEKIDMHDYKKDIGELHQNAAGWLREAIVRDYKLSEEQLKKQAQVEKEKVQQEEQTILEQQAKEIQEQRLAEALADFPDDEQWVKKCVMKHVNVREMTRKVTGGKPFTEAEINEMYVKYQAEVPQTDEEKRAWLMSNDSEYALSSIMSELRAEQKESLKKDSKEPSDEQYLCDSVEDVLSGVARQKADLGEEE